MTAKPLLSDGYCGGGHDCDHDCDCGGHDDGYDGDHNDRRNARRSAHGRRDEPRKVPPHPLNRREHEDGSSSTRLEPRPDWKRETLRQNPQRRQKQGLL
jgi:hypothetical protein